MTNRCKDFDAALVPCLPVLRRRAQKLTKSPADAADLFQDTVERALRGSATFRPDTNLLAWLLTIMQRRAIDVSRQSQLWRRSGPAEVYDLPTPPAYCPVPCENVTSGQLRRAISRLPDRLRVALTLRVVNRLSCREIAQRLAIPICTVCTRLLRARLKLRKLLEQPQLLREWPKASSEAQMRPEPVTKTAARG